MEEQELELAFVEECGDGRCGCGELLAPLLAISDPQGASEREAELGARGGLPPESSRSY